MSAGWSTIESDEVRYFHCGCYSASYLFLLREGRVCARVPRLSSSSDWVRRVEMAEVWVFAYWDAYRESSRRWLKPWGQGRAV